jgi:hypothetical protein
MGGAWRILIGSLLLAVAIGAWTTWIVLRRRAIAAGTRRKARADAHARAADEHAVPADAPEPVAPDAEREVVEPAVSEAATDAGSHERVVERGVAAAPPMSIRAARRAQRKTARRNQGGGGAVAAEMEAPSAAGRALEQPPAPTMVEANLSPVVIAAPAAPTADPDGEPVTATSAAESDHLDDVGGEPAVAARRGRTLTERPRRQTSRRPAPDPAPPSPAEPPRALDDASTRRGRRPTVADRSAPGRTRRGAPADLPKRARGRRRFGDSPSIDPELPPPPLGSEPEVD